MFAICLIGFIVYIVYLTCKKDNNLINAMFGKWTKFNFIPFVIMFIQYIIYNNVNTRLFKSIFIADLIFSIFGLISLLFIYVNINIPFEWYITLAIKKGAFSSLIFSLWLQFCNDIVILSLWKDNISDISPKSIQAMLIIWSILIGLGMIIFSFCFSDLMAIFLNLLFFINCLITFSILFKFTRGEVPSVLIGLEIICVLMTIF